MPIKDIVFEEDPYHSLGFGIGAYFDLLKTLIFAMIILFIISLPTMYIY